MELGAALGAMHVEDPEVVALYALVLGLEVGLSQFRASLLGSFAIGTQGTESVLDTPAQTLNRSVSNFTLVARV
jgi:hypothetical protein